MLKQRVITAVIMAAVVLATLFYFPPIAFAGLITFVVLVAAWEWAQLVYLQGLARFVYAASVGAVMLLSAWLLGLNVDAVLTQPQLLIFIVGVAGLWWLLVTFFVAVYPAKKSWAHKPIQGFIGFLVLVPTWLGLVFLRAEDNGQWLIVMMIIAVVCADTGAYFVGRKFGKKKLAPNVSPGKSWEGFYGGFVCSLMFALALISVLGFNQSNLWLLAILAVTSLASVYGDLLESMLKRERGIKDSGTILPGHGGILDRADSITAAAPVFTLMYLISGWQL